MTIYVGCALSHATQEYKDKIETLKRHLRSLGYTVLDFIGLTRGDCRDVFNRDVVECVGGCQLFVAVADHPSTGLGIEIGAALWKYNVPTLIVGQNDAVVTRLAQDMDHPLVSFQCYEDMIIDIPRLIQEKVDNTPCLRQVPSLLELTREVD